MSEFGLASDGVRGRSQSIYTNKRTTMRSGSAEKTTVQTSDVFFDEVISHNRYLFHSSSKIVLTSHLPTPSFGFLTRYADSYSLNHVPSI